jgi:transposase-like protein
MQMQRTKYAAEFKSKAVKQVIDKGHPVVDGAKRLGIPNGVLYPAGRVTKPKQTLEFPQACNLITYLPYHDYISGCAHKTARSHPTRPRKDTQT